MHRLKLPPALAGLLDPLNFAAYVAWGVVYLTNTGAIAERLPEMLVYARIALLAFLFCFMLATRTHETLSGRKLATLCVLMASSALFVIYLRPFGTGNILLVLFAAVLAARLSPKPLTLWLVATNSIVLALMLTGTDATWSQALLSVLAYSSFQAFASLVIRNMRLAEQMADALRATNAELMTTRLLLAESVRDTERLRLSRELHDVAGHGLTALKLNLGVLARDAKQPDPERIGLCAQLSDELLQNLRHVVQQLRDDPGPDLKAVLQRIALPFPRPQLQLELSDSLPTLSFNQVEAVMRAVQEALTNAAKHGVAKNLKVALSSDDGYLRLQIEDDGRAPAKLQVGGGLSGMRERFEDLGGSLAVHTAAVGGLRLQASFPLNGNGGAT